ncbi:MAG: cytochrome c oxidase subunit 3 family protein [Desulfatitalea sp.]|nr:cytochrome c oxidase subunit 3 [Desulfatitalea sp.]NNJ99324.1 cytochrome c oxidase subunit 3 family protein [Desulfatitalea sp.]
MNAENDRVNLGLVKQLVFAQKEGHVPGELGIWIFILGDMTLYLLLIISFMVERYSNYEMFTNGALSLHPTIGGINMLLLLTSSLTVALAVKAVREKIMEKAAPALVRITMTCGFIFIINKYFEYNGLVREGYPPLENVFYTWYYVLTGIHLTHLIGGMFVLRFMLKISQIKDKRPEDIRNMESCASFWHAVDILWIILFPLLYLLR